MIEFLRAELAPAPGRLNATIRVVVASMIVLATSMTLEVPEIALSLFIVLYLTMMVPGVSAQNSVFVALGGTIALVALTLGLVAALLVFRFTMDYPPLRLAAMALGLFVGLYLSRIFVAGAAGWVFAFVILVTQAYVDLFPGPEPMVRAILWVWMVIAYPAVLTIAVNLWLLPADPEPLLRGELAARLNAVARAIRGSVAPALRGSVAPALGGSPKTDELGAFLPQGSALVKLVHLSEIQDSTLKARHGERLATIDLVQRLVEAAALFADRALEPSPDQRARLERVAQICERFAAAIGAGAALPELAPAEEGDAVPPVIARLERLVRELPAAQHAAAGYAEAATAPFVADAFTNPRYAQFALKVTLAAMLCYVIYTALDWPGIHTCMMTCAIIALGSAGATIHKGTLRLAGVAIGGTAALFAIVFVVPHLTSLPGLMLLVAPVTALATWVAMGRERTAYVGLQIAFSFYLAVIQDFSPGTDVTEFRDRLVGVALGVTVMAVVFAYVWPERAASGMVESLRTALRRMAELARGTGNPRAVRAAAWRSLAEAERFAELAAFEPETLTPAGAARRRRVRGRIDKAKRALLAQAA